jgi:hypothetical protein
VTSCERKPDYSEVMDRHCQYWLPRLPALGLTEQQLHTRSAFAASFQVTQLIRELYGMRWNLCTKMRP